MKLAWYGDDFTGSTDVLEALTLAGVRARLFLEAPDDPGDVEAAGLAGTSRAMSPAEMDRELPRAFAALRAPTLHYKTCSTFDSSPAIGSIGRAIEIGRRVTGARWVPLVVGAPALRRYTVFGQLFATLEGVTHRIDRHPVASRHPVTPMDESDLRRHLARQTALRVELFDVLQLDAPEVRFDPAADVVLFDVLRDAHLETIGRLLEEHKPRFVAGSSGIEYALTAKRPRVTLPPVDAADQILVLSGSCSAVTARQIEWALANGYEGLRMGAGVERRAAELLKLGRSVVIYTALGPDDPAVGDARADGAALGERLGEACAALLRHVRRVVVAGGDTSGRVGRRLGLRSLDMIAPVAPGSPLCRADVDGLEIAMKGGQVGRPDYFEKVRLGTRRRDEHDRAVRGGRQDGMSDRGQPEVDGAPDALCRG
ncbi:MAG TPA: four-carbon acid sugar kinase family protein [Planctomycetota bacterium]